MEKDNISIKTNKKGEYISSIIIKNNNLLLKNLFDMNIFQLVYTLNTEMFSDFNLNIKDESNANVYFLAKHFFEDFGVPQFYFSYNVNKKISNNTIFFECESVKLQQAVKYVEYMNLERLSIKCDIIESHTAVIDIVLKLDLQTIEIPTFVEKAIIQLIYKMILKVKEFIENYHYKVLHND
jgi:hypothetical protein